MAYSELVKSFERIRSYMREFYVYGFRTRDEFSEKSGRSYDNERRRLESILGDYTSSSRTAGGKNVYLSIDSRKGGGNPLYRLLRTCSFTDRDITLHFLLFDMLRGDISMTLSEILEGIEDYTVGFEYPLTFDGSGVRKKLAEYVKLGLIVTEKEGRQVRYRRREDADISTLSDALEFFAEVGVCGVIGSFISDRLSGVSDVFEFKHHYITHTLDSEVLYQLLLAIGEKRIVELSHCSRDGNAHTWRLLPLKIFVSVQNGRRWLMAYSFSSHEIKAYRLDYISDVTLKEPCARFDELRDTLTKMQNNMWGVACQKKRRSRKHPDDTISMHIEHVEFTIHFEKGEEFILQRLEREKRCGTVEIIDENTARFSADVADSGEMVPWILTFIGRLDQLDLSNRTVENRLRSDIKQMYELYGIGGGEDDIS